MQSSKRSLFYSSLAFIGLGCSFAVAQCADGEGEAIVPTAHRISHGVVENDETLVQPSVGAPVVAMKVSELDDGEDNSGNVDTGLEYVSARSSRNVRNSMHSSERSTRWSGVTKASFISSVLGALWVSPLDML